MPPATAYRRISRNLGGAINYSSLWLADDHLLIVASTGYNESYARVMLRDVKAMFITQTDRHVYWNIAWSVLALIPGVRCVYAVSVGEAPYVAAPFFALGVLGLALSLARGPGCRVTVITGVQTLVLPTLVRRRKTRRVLFVLEPKIAAAQADLVRPTPVQAAPVTPPTAVPPQASQPPAAS